jgi:hypothetical protein
MSATAPVLVIPTHVTNGFFKEAFNSVNPFVECFKSVIVSINNRDGLAGIQACNQSFFNGSETIWETKADLSPIGHFIWYTQKLKRLYPPSQQIMFLCYDDLLKGENMRDLFVRSGNSEETSARICLGDYELIGDEYPSDKDYCIDGTAQTFGRRYSKPGMTRLQWFVFLQSQGHAFTNLSGTIATLRVLSDVARFLRLTAARKGLRFEYMLASHRSVRRIHRHRAPLVAVRRHGSQEGRNVEPIDAITDELRYSFWLLLNAQSLKEFVFHLRSRNGVATMLLLISRLPTMKGKYTNVFELVSRIAQRLFPSLPVRTSPDSAPRLFQHA